MKEVSGISYMTYKNKPLVRVEDTIYYGDFDAPFVVLMIIDQSKKLQDLTISTKIDVVLQTNKKGVRPRIIKKAKRESLYKALDIAEYWLEEALSEG